MVDGLKTFYKTVLPNTPVRGAHPLVLVHGFGMSSEHFAKNMHEIADAIGAPVHAIDLIGFGRSDKPGEPVYGIDLWQRQLEVFLDDIVGADKVFLAGNSIGGYVCMNVAADRPSECAGLSLINSAGTWGAINPLGVPVPWLAYAPVARALGRAMFHAARKPEHVARTLARVYVDQSAVDAALIESILQPTRSPEAELAGPQLFSSLFLAPVGRTWAQLLGGAGGYKGPTIALWGDKDPWLHAGFVRMLEALCHDLEVRWMEDTGHCPHHERPDLFNRRLSDWIRLNSSSPPSSVSASSVASAAIQAQVDKLEAEVEHLTRHSRDRTHVTHVTSAAALPVRKAAKTAHVWDTPGSTWTGWDMKGHKH